MDEILAAIESRLGRLEMILSQHPLLVEEKTHFDRVETAQFLKKSVSTVIRKQKDDPRFPKPDFVNGQFIWEVSALRIYKQEGQFQKL